VAISNAFEDSNYKFYPSLSSFAYETCRPEKKTEPPHYVLNLICILDEEETHVNYIRYNNG
jgi:hypothetical protein